MENSGQIIEFSTVIRVINSLTMDAKWNKAHQRRVARKRMQLRWSTRVLNMYMRWGKARRLRLIKQGKKPKESHRVRRQRGRVIRRTCRLKELLRIPYLLQKQQEKVEALEELKRRCEDLQRRAKGGEDIAQDMRALHLDTLKVELDL